MEQESIKDLKVIQPIISNGEEIADLDGWFSKCLKILENIIYMKKYLSHLGVDIFARKGIRTFIETLKSKKIYGFDQPIKFSKANNPL